MPDADILQDPDRLAKLRSLNLLDPSADPAFDRLTRFAAKLLKAPLALVTFLEEDRQIIKGQVGLHEPWATRMETPLSHSVCQYVVYSRQALVVPDARIHALAGVNLTAFEVMAYAGIPLITPDGYALGAFCVMDRQPRHWTPDEIETLTEIAQSVMTEIELRSEIIENVKSAASLSAADMVLTRERNLLRTVLDTIPIGVFMKDTSGHYLFVNSGFAAYVNHTPEELIGTDVRQLYGSLGELYYQEDMEILGSGQSRIGVEETHPDYRDPTQLRWYLTSKVPLLDENLQTYGLLGVVTDITERKKSEEALLASQQQLQAAVMNAPIVFFAIDAEGVFTISVGKALELIDMKPGELVGKSVFEVFENDAGVIERFRRVLGGETFATLVETSNYLYFDTTYSPMLDKDGKVTGAIAVGVDVSERVHAEVALQDRIEQLKTLRRIEAELNATLEVNQVLLFGLDVASRVSGAEHGFIGLVEGDTVRLAKPLGQYAGFSSFPITHGTIRHVLDSKQALWLQDVTQSTDYVADIPGTVAMILLPLIRHGRVIGVMDLETSHTGFFDSETFEFLKLVAARLAVALENAQLYEVSTRQLAELQELYGRVSYLERLKTDMIRIAAHDLRNPLTAIMGLTELILESHDSLTLDHLDLMRDIDKAARQMYKMTGDILSIQRIEQSAAEFRPIDVVGIVQNVYNNSLIHANRKRQTFELRIPSTSVLVKGDDVQLREAIDNLVSNAIKYTPEGGRVCLRLSIEDPQHIRLEVEDTGYGIPENQQARLFQPFYRAKTAETRQIEGTGLGLHLVKNIIERHSGQLTVQSVYGKGSTFAFTLKVYRDGSQPPG
ncbi:MAG: PAS domain-containing protein [Anaerolineae bacterium]|nr:PAS domain-containing protein [Anaerolineae bacterium]